MVDVAESKIIDKIRKLLALSQSPNQFEAAEAAARASKLMLEYELEMADIKQSESPDKDCVVSENASDDSFKNIETWRTILSNGVAKGFGCHIWWEQVLNVNGKRVHNLRAMGRRSNICAFRYMFAYLNMEIERMSKDAWVKLPQTDRPVAAAAIRWYNSFKVGASVRIAQRLDNEREALFQNAARSGQNATALAVVQKGQQEVDQAFIEHKKKQRIQSIRSHVRNVEEEAMAMGAEAANGISLSGGKQLGSPSKQLKST